MNTRQILDLIAHAIERFKSPSSCTQVIGGLDTEQSPTQSDKPSPRSSLAIQTLRRYLRAAYPSKYKIYGVQDTNSMEPFIDDNSLVVVEPVDDDMELHEGMVLIYDGSFTRHANFQGKLIMHAVTGVRDNSVYMKGHNNYGGDGWVPREAVLYNLVNVGYARQEEAHD